MMDLNSSPFTCPGPTAWGGWAAPCWSWGFPSLCTAPTAQWGPGLRRTLCKLLIVSPLSPHQPFPILPGLPRESLPEQLCSSLLSADSICMGLGPFITQLPEKEACNQATRGMLLQLGLSQTSLRLVVLRSILGSLLSGNCKDVDTQSPPLSCPLPQASPSCFCWLNISSAAQALPLNHYCLTLRVLISSHVFIISNNNLMLHNIISHNYLKILYNWILKYHFLFVPLYLVPWWSSLWIIFVTNM